MKSQKGMTMIALVLTISLAVILIGITIGLAISNHGVLNPKTYEEYNKKVETMRELNELDKNLSEGNNAEATQAETTEADTSTEATANQ